MKMSSDAIKKKNRLALCLCAVAAALIVVLLSLPVYQFTTSLYTKKSSNTFIGDEKYIAARAEVDTLADGYRQSGEFGDVEVTEAVTERVNSKGEKTSLITFSIKTQADRTGWQFMASGLPSGKILLVMALLVGVGLLLAVLGVVSSFSSLYRSLPRADKILRTAACWIVLLALILVPIFSMNTTVTFERRLIPHLSDADTSSIAALMNTADEFLYGGSAGENIGKMLGSLEYNTTYTLWLAMPALFAMLLGMIVLRRGTLGKTLSRGLLYVFVIGLCVLILYPYYVMLITGFRTNAETTDMYFTNMFPTKWIWSNMTDIINRGVPRFLLNSLLLSGGATILALGCGIPAAYAMARMQFKGKKIFLGFVIMSQMFAPVVLLVGISRLMNTLKLNDTVFGLMLINAAFNQAFAIWLLRGTFVSISSEMEQAACIDGCSTVGALIRVLLPMAAPGIVTTLIFVFINAWNEYTISTVLISTPAKRPITVGITQFSSFNMIEWQYLFASALIATIPVIIMFMFIEKHLVAGLTSGGVKG